MHELEEGLAEIVGVVWERMLGLHSERSTQPVEASSAECYMARVEWQSDTAGTLVIECPDALLREAAAVLFSLDSEDATEADLFDTLGELINVIAGNARALFEGDPAFSLPDVDRSDSVENWLERKCGEVWFLSEGSPFRVFASTAGGSDVS